MFQARRDWGELGNYNEKNKVAKKIKNKPFQIPPKLLVTLFLYTSCKAEN